MSQPKPHPIFPLLQPYLQNPEPDHAIMIDGKWGSGKTFYLKKELFVSKQKEIKKLSFWYASANGIKSFEDLAAQLMLNQSKKKIIKKCIKIAKSLVPQINSVSYSDMLTLMPFDESNVIIIDDLERVDQACDLIGLLGQINTAFVEHNNIKTLLVCDEKELIDRFHSEIIIGQGGDSSQDKEDLKEERSTLKRSLLGTQIDYRNAKEKLVRRTFKFDGLKNTIDTIIESTDFESLPLKYKQTVKEVFILTESQNLRVLKFILYNLKAIYQELEPQNGKLALDMTYYIVPVVVTDTIDYVNGKIKKAQPKTQGLKNFTQGIEVVVDPEQFFSGDQPSRFRTVYGGSKYRYRRLQSLRIFLSTGQLSENIINEVIEWAKQLKIESEATKRLVRLNNPFSYTKNHDLKKDMTEAIASLTNGAYSFDQFNRFISASSKYLKRGIPFGNIKSDEELTKLCTDYIDLVVLDDQSYIDHRMYQYRNDQLNSLIQDRLIKQNQKITSTSFEAAMSELVAGTINPQNNVLHSALNRGIKEEIDKIIEVYISRVIVRKPLLEAIERLFPGHSDSNPEIGDNLVRIYNEAVSYTHLTLPTKA